MDIIAWLDTLWHDLRYAARILRKSPGFTIVAVLSLAVGIGANTTIFTAINAVLLRPLPYPNSDRFVAIFNTRLLRGGERISVSTADLLHWRDENRVFEQIEGSEWGIEGNALTGAGTPERVGLQYVTWGLCPLLGVRPVIGRLVTNEKDVGKQNLAGVFISYEFWQRHFASDPNIVGRSIFVDNSPGWVMAVLPPGFDLFGHGPADIIEPIGLDRMGPSATQRWLIGVGKLKPGISVEQAQASMDVIARHMEQADPEDRGLISLI